MNIKDIFPHRKTRPAIGLIIVFGMVAVFALNLKHGYDEKLAKAASDSQILARTTSQQVAATLQKIDLVLNTLVDEFSPEHGDKGLYPQRISNYMLKLQFKQLDLKSLRIIKADRRVLYTLTDGEDVVSPLTLGDDAFFTAHRDNPNLGLTLSEPAQEHGNPGRSLILSRRLNNPNGSFAGIAAATVSLTDFEIFSGTLNLGSNDSLTLLNDRLAILARFPDGERFRGKSLTGSALEAQMRRSPRDDGIYSGAFEVDGVERIYSVSQVGDLLLYVNAGLAKRDVLAEWRRSALIDGIVMAALIAAILFLSDGRLRRPGAGRKREVSPPSFYVRNLIDASLDPLVILSPEGIIRDVNPAAENITGVPHTQLIGSDFCNYFTEPDKAREGYLKALADGFVRDCPLVIRNANGHVSEVLWNIAEYRGETGDVRGAYAVAKDVSELRRSERLLKFENHALETACGNASLNATLDLLCRGMEAILDESMCAIMLLDGDGLHLRHGAAPSLPNDYVQASDGTPVGPTASFLGAAAHAGLQAISTDIAHDPLWEDSKDLALNHGLAACCVTPVLSRKKDLLGIFAVYYPTSHQPTPFDLQADSRAAHLAGVIIQRKRADQVLTNFNETLQKRVADASAKIEGDRAEHLASIALLRKRADESLNQLKKDIEQRVAADTSAVIGDSRAKHLASIALQRKRADESLSRLKKDMELRVSEEVAKILAQERNSMQRSSLAATSEIIDGIAHQWRQPLNALDLMLANIKDAQRHQELDPQMLVQSAIEGRQIIHDMSSAIDNFRNSFRPDKEKVSFSLDDRIQSAIEILSAGLRDHNIKTQVEAGSDVIAYGFPNDYYQVLLNVLNNAKDALIANDATNGVIHIRVARVGGQACVVVRDNAGGIPSDILAKIFEPHFATLHKGAGIGLYMSKVIMEGGMDGKIEVRNVEGGTEFVLTCPVAK